MSTKVYDIAIVGAGPVGLMCAYLANLCGLRAVAIDRSDGPLEVGRADALNARTLQLLEIVKLFDKIYPLGKTCNTSSVWSKGRFLSRQSSWWDQLEGCFHKHFLMLGQSYIEKLLDNKLKLNQSVLRNIQVEDIKVDEEKCFTTLSAGDVFQSKYVIGADGSRSMVREKFNINFEITRPQIVWAVIDGVIDTDFNKVPEIIVFQSETSDVAWIPREGEIDRFYVRMDKKNFSLEEAVAKINRAILPHQLTFRKIEWFSQFSVKESVAEKFSFKNRVFLAGDSCHIHSVNGGQGLNTGLGDAFNLVWKLNMVINHKFPQEILKTYESERKPVALSVIATSGELVRSTKYSSHGTHAEDYVDIVKKRAGNITGMGISYGEGGVEGSRLFDFEIFKSNEKQRLYSLLDYSYFTLLVFSDSYVSIDLPKQIKLIQIHEKKHSEFYWTEKNVYKNQVVLVRPDAYIEASAPINQNELGDALVAVLSRYKEKYTLF